MPELPEVEALREYLDEHLAGRVVERVLPLAVSVLKTYDPPLTALEGRPAGAVARHGKFLDLRIGELHLVTHLARARARGWGRAQPPPPPRARYGARGLG
ncbi:DNA-formamidopyrimidine glycosylase family protein, partial [Streptomyces yangpuensis]|uniref:DNA-formamidopyrimidine glycosylase family protein n=1 Tax=Streptomyces yangpuensis TaxID=1648182 RepID=UPI0036B5F4B4